MSFEVRPAKPEESAEIAGVMRASFRQYDGIFDPPSGAVSETEDSVREKFGDSSGFVAVLEGRIVGTVFCKPLDEETLYLFRLCALPDQRSMGIGRALVEVVEDKAREEGFAFVELGTRVIIPQNVLFYEKLGYTHERDIPHVNNPDGPLIIAVMRKGLRVIGSVVHGVIEDEPA